MDHPSGGSDDPGASYREILEKALEKARRENHVLGEGKILLDLGFSYEDAGEMEKAVECFEAGIKPLKSSPQFAAALPALFHLAEIYRTQKKNDRAFGLYSDMVELGEKAWDKRSLGLGLAHKGQILLEQKAYENGFEFLFRAFQTFEEAKMKESSEIRSMVAEARNVLPRPLFELALSRSRIPQRLKDLLRG